MSRIRPVTLPARTQPATDLPERLPCVGEMVRVRTRRWLVEQVTESDDPRASAVVRLACADDDAQGRWCPYRGNFKIHHQAVLLLNATVREGKRTQQEIVDHFSRIIKAENNRSGQMAAITGDYAQAFGFDNITPAP